MPPALLLLFFFREGLTLFPRQASDEACLTYTSSHIARITAMCPTPGMFVAMESCSLFASQAGRQLWSPSLNNWIIDVNCYAWSSGLGVFFLFFFLKRTAKRFPRAAVSFKVIQFLHVLTSMGHYHSSFLISASERFVAMAHCGVNLHFPGGWWCWHLLCAYLHSTSSLVKSFMPFTHFLSGLFGGFCWWIVRFLYRIF
jgi:hypothetical protein